MFDFCGALDDGVDGVVCESGLEWIAVCLVESEFGDEGHHSVTAYLAFCTNVVFQAVETTVAAPDFQSEVDWIVFIGVDSGVTCEVDVGAHSMGAGGQ